jgi:serine protease Do
MKKMTSLLGSAILGSALTIGAFQAFELDGRKVVIEHSNAVPTASVSLKSSVPGSSAADFTYAAEKTMPAVVHIKATHTASNYQARQYRQLPDPFRWFFEEDPFHSPRQRRGPQARVSSGSGVIINEKGYIVTNNHVIDGADDLEVSLYDNRSFKAEVVGTDPLTDLALLKIEESGLPYLSLIDSDDVQVGEWVLAVGNPFNLASTVTAGIVSAKARDIGILQDGENSSAIESFIQTDAAVNPGNSGGALVNMNGDLVGINTAIASPTGAYSGYAFAVPSNIVNKVVEDLLAYGAVQRAYLGVYIRSVDGKLAKELDLDVTEGVLIDSIVDNSSASASALRKGDVILKINGSRTSSVPKLQEVIGSHRPGDEVTVTVSRQGDLKELPVVLKNRNGNTEVVAGKSESKVLEMLGADFKELSKEELEKYRLSSGVQIEEVKRGKLSKYTNIQKGFIITKIDGHPVNSVEDITELLENKKGGVMIEGVYPGYNQIWYFAIGM